MLYDWTCFSGRKPSAVVRARGQVPGVRCPPRRRLGARGGGGGSSTSSGASARGGSVRMGGRQAGPRGAWGRARRPRCPQSALTGRVPGAVPRCRFPLPRGRGLCPREDPNRASRAVCDVRALRALRGARAARPRPCSRGGQVGLRSDEARGAPQSAGRGAGSAGPGAEARTQSGARR